MQAALDLLAVAASCIAVVFDERSRRIPNWLTYSTLLLGLALRVAWLIVHLDQASEMLLPAAVGGITLLLLFGALSFAGVLGFGDTKLLTGIGVCVGHPLSLQVAVCVLASGGVVALVHVLRRRSGRAVVSNLANPHTLVRERVDDPARAQKHLFGYALAIALGTVWAVVGRRMPWLLPL
jgi:prepilin peptidase CpaA